MFELLFPIDTADYKKLNKKIMLVYFAVYMAVAVVGGVCGALAAALGKQKSLFILGIIIVVFSGILLVLAVLMAIAPKNYLTPVVEPDRQEANVKFDIHGLTVDGENVLAFADMSRVKQKDGVIYIYSPKDRVFIVKNNIVSGGTFDELFAYLADSCGKLLPPSRQDDTQGQEQEQAEE